jgi:hypothetical protein
VKREVSLAGAYGAPCSAIMFCRPGAATHEKNHALNSRPLFEGGALPLLDVNVEIVLCAGDLGATQTKRAMRHAINSAVDRLLRKRVQRCGHIHLGEMRVGACAYFHPDRIVGVLETGADVRVRGKCKRARRHDKIGQLINFLAVLPASGRSCRVRGGSSLAVRLVANHLKRVPQKRGVRPEGMLDGKAIRFSMEPLRPPAGSFC